ncbi:MAG: cob(I)yrinic acid a,c-diamide adenosyltransferase [Planctomycetota bacterium]
MVRLDRIYTKSGDKGATSLGDGTRMPKYDVRIAAYGTSDELSSVLGLLLTEEPGEPMQTWIRGIQNDLFDVGADLCVPGSDKGEKGSLRVTPAYTAALEKIIDEVNENIPPLKTFILPGGTRIAAWLHLARTVCRRAERLVCQLVEEDGREVNPEVLVYLNRLSDLFFVLSRAANENGKLDALWQPGLRQE